LLYRGSGVTGDFAAALPLFRAAAAQEHVATAQQWAPREAELGDATAEEQEAPR
jgi:hypothetical protein